MLYMLKANKYFGVIKFILGGYNYLRFDNEELFKELVKKYGKIGRASCRERV